MTGLEFRTTHGDPTGWTTADTESQQNLAAIDEAFPDCWFCEAENPAQNRVCGFCNHHAADGPAPTLTTAA